MEAKTINCQLSVVRGWVRREKTAAAIMKDKNGDVPIKNEDTGEVLNLIKETDVPTPIENGFLVSDFFLHKRFKYLNLITELAIHVKKKFLDFCITHMHASCYVLLITSITFLGK